MTEQAKREPKDGELWWVVLNNNAELTVIAEWIGEQNHWFSNFIFDTESVTPIAPVASHELVRELVEALKDAQGGLDYIRKSHGELYGVGFDRCETQTLAVLAKAKLAGLGE